MDDDITGIILSGGKSSRMGMNKALVDFAGRPVISRSLELMAAVFRHVSIITNDPACYEFLHVPLHGDEYPDAGPLAGIHSALMHSSGKKCFIIACDLPLMTQEMIRYLAGYRTAHPITLARANGRVHHLCGIYEQRCLPIAEKILQDHSRTLEDGGRYASRTLSVRALCELAGAEVIDAEALPFYTHDLFFNLNRPLHAHGGHPAVFIGAAISGERCHDNDETDREGFPHV
jgi:molybdenum cofactor guanylyltransferase